MRGRLGGGRPGVLLLAAVIGGPLGCGGSAPIGSGDGGDSAAGSGRAVADAAGSGAGPDHLDVPHDRSSYFEIPLTQSPFVTRDLDILFMIDTSPGMAPLQAKLVAAVPAFIDALQALPGGLPNLHLAVVSSDMGAGQ